MLRITFNRKVGNAVSGLGSVIKVFSNVGSASFTDLLNLKEAAETAANTATTKAGEASTSANTATTKAGEASASATAALTNKNLAETAANTATTKAGEASASATSALASKNLAETAANTATTKAGEASASATAALTNKNLAETAANTATAKAGEASASATAALTNKNLAETAANTAATKAGEASASATAASESAALAASITSAMSQAQFEAIRAQNKEKYAASGFVQFGKHAQQLPSIVNANEGLWTYAADGFQNKLVIGRVAPYAKAGKSRTDSPVLHVVGVIFDVSVLPNGEWDVKFPQAPDGKTTYNKSTGVVTTHATVTAAFTAQAADPANVEVVTDRVDMWGFEAFLEEVNIANPYVYPNGLIQSQATTMDGIATSASAHPVTYYAAFDGDTTSKGKGVNFFNLTDAQKKKVLGNHKNNLYYLDDGRLVQWRLRQRTIAGAGNGDWASVVALASVEDLMFDISLSTTRVRPQGASNNSLAYTIGEPYIPLNSSSAKYANAADSAIYYMRNLSANDSKAINGECYFLVCGTVNKLNQGAYHPSLNPSGASSVVVATGQAGKWYSHNYLMGKADCFNFGGSNDIGKVLPAAIEYTSYWSGRPDGRSYDVIYADGQGGVCRDMRYSANGVDSVDFAEADQRVKKGAYRGFELLRHTKVISFTCSTAEVGQDWGRIPMTHAEALRVAGLLQITQDVVFSNKNMAVSLYNPANGLVIHASSLILVQGNTHFGSYLDPQNSLAIWLGFNPSVAEANINGFSLLSPASATVEAVTSPFCSNGQTLYAIFTELKTTSIGGSFLQTDVIGNPANTLATPALANGWQGSWVSPFDAVYHLSRKALLSSGMQTYTTDNGVTWGSAALPIDAVNNALTKGGSGLVLLAQYQAFAKQTENAANAPVYGGDAGVGNVYAQSLYVPEWGCVFGESLCGIVCKNTVVPEGVMQPLTGYLRNPYGEFNGANVNLPKHAALNIVLVPSNNSPAFKALDYNVNINQQAFIQYAYTELRHNGTNWGDDGKLAIVNNQSAKTDLNGNTVLIGTAKLREPIGWIKNKV